MELTIQSLIKKWKCKLCIILLVFINIHGYSQMDFYPTADTDNQTDVAAGTNTDLSFSQWCHSYIRFDLSTETGTVTNAMLRLYLPGGIGASTINVSTTNTDNWTEGAALPSKGTAITSLTTTGFGAGYAEIDLTTHVISKMTSNKIVSITITGSASGWTSFSSRESSHKPELVVTSTGGAVVNVSSVSVTPATATLPVGSTLQLAAILSPKNATNKNITWSSSNNSIASINSAGLVTAVAQGNVTLNVVTEDGSKTASCQLKVVTPTMVTMSPGTNFWNITWEGTTNYFKGGVDWTTTTDPWNPDLIKELKESKMKTLRFMDWNVVNYASVKNWNQRIPKTANHYNSENTIPCFEHNYDEGTNTHSLIADVETYYGVAYEWQIDLCNRIDADMWINIPVTATADYQLQLATLIKNQLKSNLKVYIEWGNETWNWYFASCVYSSQQGEALKLDTITLKNDPTSGRIYTVYSSVRAFEQFETVFGKNSPRLVKLIAGQVGYHHPGTDFNHQTSGDLACLQNKIINPNSVSVNAVAAAPYMGFTNIGGSQSAIDWDVDYMMYMHNSLKGTGIKLICYEGGADNYPDNGLVITRDPLMEQINYDYLAAMDDYCEGVFCQYTMYGGCWGIKNKAGEDAAINPKWRGWINYWTTHVPIPANEELHEISNDQEILLYPNPARENIYLQLDKSFSGKISINIYNYASQQVKNITLDKDTEEVRLPMFVGDLSSGIYIVEVITLTKQVKQKFMKL